jgi:anti-anti-sigma regulatory factor
MRVVVDAHTLAVDQVRLGDHAFVAYADDEGGWPIAAAFAGQGYAAGDKVIIVPAPAVSREEAGGRVAALDGMLGQALAGGHVICAGMRELIGPGRGFSAPRQLALLREAAGQARREGYRGLRLFVDMRWTHDLGVDVESMMAWEGGAHSLFASGEFAAVCGYDRRAFAAPVVEAMWAGHPVALLERPGELRGYRSARGCHLIGDADIATRSSFRAAVTAALDSAGERVLVDLSRLCFLSAGCAGDLIRLTAAADCQQVVVRCSSAQAGLLRQLGAASVPGLVLDRLPRSR